MVEMIPEQHTNDQKIYILPKTITAESIIDKALWSVFALLILAVVATFFVEDIPNAVINARQFAIDSLWLILCGFTIGELLKQIYRNKGRGTTEYKAAKKEAEELLASLTAEELSERQAYCKEYEENEYNNCFDSLLLRAGITKDEYKEYAHLNASELKKRFPQLSKMQRTVIVQLNELKPIHYDPSFFLSSAQVYGRRAPSQLYNADAENKRNTFTSFFTTAISSLCALSFAGDIIFSFSLATLVAAVVKVATILIFGSFKAIFGWNLAMRTEINKYAVITKECNNLKAWCKAKQK